MERRIFRGVALFEGLSLLLLFFVAMPLKYALGRPEAVRVVGMIHGILFLIYLVSLAQVTRAEKWSWSRILQGLIASSLPFGTFWFDAKYLKASNKTA